MLSNDGPALLPMLVAGNTAAPVRGPASWSLPLYSLVSAGAITRHVPTRCSPPARDVNDYTSGAGRPRLATLIPAVIGLTENDLHIDAGIALRSAILALPVVAAERQRVMAVSILACEARPGRPGWASAGNAS